MEKNPYRFIVLIQHQVFTAINTRFNWKIQTKGPSLGNRWQHTCRTVLQRKENEHKGFLDTSRWRSISCDTVAERCQQSLHLDCFDLSDVLCSFQLFMKGASINVLISRNIPTLIKSENSKIFINSAGKLAIWPMPMSVIHEYFPSLLHLILSNLSVISSFSSPNLSMYQ